MNLIHLIDKLAAFFYYIDFEEQKYKHYLFCEKFHPFDWGILFVDLEKKEDYCNICNEYFGTDTNLCKHLSIKIVKYTPNDDLNYDHILTSCSISEFERINLGTSNFCENYILLGDLNGDEDEIWKKIEEFVFPIFIEPQEIEAQNQDIN